METCDDCGYLDDDLTVGLLLGLEPYDEWKPNDDGFLLGLTLEFMDDCGCDDDDDSGALDDGLTLGLESECDIMDDDSTSDDCWIMEGDDDDETI